MTRYVIVTADTIDLDHAAPDGIAVIHLSTYYTSITAARDPIENLLHELDSIDEILGRPELTRSQRDFVEAHRNLVVDVLLTHDDVNRAEHATAIAGPASTPPETGPSPRVVREAQAFLEAMKMATDDERAGWVVTVTPDDDGAHGRPEYGYGPYPDEATAVEVKAHLEHDVSQVPEIAGTRHDVVEILRPGPDDVASVRPVTITLHGSAAPLASAADRAAAAAAASLEGHAAVIEIRDPDDVTIRRITTG